METNNHLHAAASGICRNIWPQSKNPITLKGLKITALALTTLALLHTIHVAYTVSLGKAAPLFLLSFVPVVISAVTAHCLSKEKTNTKLRAKNPVLEKLPLDQEKAIRFFSTFKQRTVPHEQRAWSAFVAHHWGIQLGQLNWKATFQEPNYIIIRNKEDAVVVNLKFTQIDTNYLIEKVETEQIDNKQS